MPVISAIKPQRSKDRVNIYLDGEFGFGLDLENFVTLGLKLNQELSEVEVEKIIKKAEFQKTLDKLLRFATLRPRSEKEVRDWFRRRKVHESLHPELFNRLKRLELTDDEKFASWWIEQRQSFKPKSKRVLRLELGIKGIKKEIVDTVLGETKIDEVKIAKEILAKKAYKWQSFEPRLARQKMSQYLAGKGFSWEAVEAAVDAFLDK
jgi:regulatory protein